MTNPDDVRNLEGQNAIDSTGAKIGKIGQVYVDDQSSQPLWVTVSTGLFGTRESFAPLYGSQYTADGDLQLAVTKDMVKDAPGVDADGSIDDSENEALYTYYQGHLGDTAQTTTGQEDYAAGQASDTYAADQASDPYATSQGQVYEGRDQEYAGDTREGAIGQEGVQGRDTSGPATDNAMTRSEERLHVGTETVESGRVRLRKRVVTENVTQTVPVSHEEVTLEREPITDANRDEALSGADITEEEHEVTLHAEQPVVSKETVPVERVRLGTETVSEEREVSETLRKEQIDDPATDTTTTGTTDDPVQP